ncbi:uncharacterized protein PFL1_05891 [Pseudozyma flocculosa PF-1]|uniref:DNA-directed RNA polymerase III subunit RPC9 n=2 Tax=Pseudozyma flocculosa TaxID=84751 RepID=A0A5C3F4V0_9BASI|nr:uncharacterized protein PFL1_05891 [Pseudozyma flocculosa PF-1]EPQ26570.1 hypothetical protein PFL1_05891 [Pseudozyma flocculosa PF-1]SPO38439.1 related to RPC17 - RNA polymerase III subunit C17 [Pseudozyma flocculosa]
MKVLKPRAALLSDFEVLMALKDMEADQIQRSQLVKAQKATTEVQESIYQDQEEWLEQVPENLRTIQYETIAFLSDVARPCAHQSEEAITGLLDALKSKGYSISDSEARRGGLGLNKSERLQIVNHSPSSVVELHTLVEELSERFYDWQIDDIVQLVQSYIPASSSAGVNAYAEGNEDAEAMAVNGLGQETAAEDEAMAANGYDHQPTAATQLGEGGDGGLAVVPGHDEELEGQDDDYEIDPAVEMDDDEFVNEGYGAVGVEDAEPED